MNKTSASLLASLLQRQRAGGDPLALGPEELDPHIAPQAFMRAAWVFELDRRDALLVLKALGGRLETPESVEAARALGNRLTIIRAAAAHQALKHLQRAAEDAQRDSV